MIREVSELKGLETNVVYMTKNFEMFKPVVGNRGAENGFLPKKVNNIVKLIKSGKYMEDASPILINRMGQIVDGNNRKRAHEIADTPICFRITVNAELNSKNQNKLLNAIALYNGTNTTWTGKDNFRSSLMTKAPLAVALSKVREDLVRAYNVVRGDLTAGQMYSYVTKQITLSKRTREVYSDRELAKYAKSDEFMLEMMFICRVIEYFKNTPIRPSKVLNQLMPLVWAGKVNKDKFYHNLIKYGFDAHIDKANVLRNCILDLATRRVTKKTQLIAWR